MGHQDKQVDVESLRERGRRGGCLDAFLVASVVFLFFTVTGVTVVGVMMMKELQTQIETNKRPIAEFGFSKLTGEETPQTYKMQNFAYLEAKLSHLNRNATMDWGPVLYGEGTSVGSNFIFDKEQHSLTPQKEGTYFMYANLNFTCTHKCSAGLFIMHVGDKFTCQVELPSNSRSARRKCWNVTWMKKQKLLTQIIVPEGGLHNWKLELTGSDFGMFLVD